MTPKLDPLDHRLLDDWQRDFPLTARPYAAIARALGVSEAEVLSRLARLSEQGAISRIGATCRPNTAGASTLAALSADSDEIESVAEVISAEHGVNHSYLREHEWNFWFVATGPDRAYVDATLGRISAATGRRVLDLRLVRPFNVDLGFPLDGSAGVRPSRSGADLSVLQQGDQQLIAALTEGLALTPRPFARLGSALELGETAALMRVRTLTAAGVLTRVGVIVRHRALGWRSNAMVVWRIAPERIDEVGPRLAQAPGVTLCYQRETVRDVWPYPLYCMIHARSRPEAAETLARAAKFAGLEDVRREVLFSVRCFKQKGALIAAPKGEAA